MLYEMEGKDPWIWDEQNGGCFEKRELNVVAKSGIHNCFFLLLVLLLFMLVKVAEEILVYA
jgi:hypothetical protein